MTTGPNRDDICSFGHQLVPGSDPIKIVTVDAEGRRSEQTKLLRRHAPFGSPESVGFTDPLRLVPYPCEHGIAEADLPPDHVAIPTAGGKSWGRAHWLVGPRCPVCRGEPAPADWTV